MSGIKPNRCSEATLEVTGPVPLRTADEVQTALDTAGTIAGAARLLQVSRPTLYGYIEKYGITEWKRTPKRAA